MKPYFLLPVLALFVVSCSKKPESTVAVKTVPETQYFCVAKDVTQDELPGAAGESIGPLFQALYSAGQQPGGQLSFICPKWAGGTTRSKVIFAVPVTGDVTAQAPYYIWKAPAFKCAWLSIKGPLSGLQAAWTDFQAKVTAASGENPTGAWRQVTLHWVDQDSTENETELEIGVE